MLSTINGLYDPLGIVAPFTLTGKLLLRVLRESMATNHDLTWDEPLPEKITDRWKTWVNSLPSLQEVQLPRAYNSVIRDHQYLYVYSDASQEAVAAVAYVVTTDDLGAQHASFVFGKAKVAPKHGHTIPRLELCDAVLAVELYEVCHEEMDIEFRNVKFFTDSKIVLGYLYNETRIIVEFCGFKKDNSGVYWIFGIRFISLVISKIVILIIV